MSESTNKPELVKPENPPAQTILPSVPLRTFGKGTGVPFCWQDKRILDAIRQRLDGSRQMGATLAVYLAFTEIASDEENNAFETTLPWLALKSGVSVSSIKRILPDLEELKAVVVQRKSKGLKGPSFYHLTALAHPEPTIAHPEPTIAHPEPTIAQSENTPKRATLEESNKELRRKREQKAVSPSPFSEVQKDKGKEIEGFHQLYQELTGYSEIALDMARERQWFEWLQYGITHQHPFTHDDFKLVVKLIREGIANAKSNQGTYKRNQGALKFDNLIGDPGRFEQDLAEARTHFGKRIKPAIDPNRAAIKATAQDPREKPLAAKTPEEIEREQEQFEKLRQSIEL